MKKTLPYLLLLSAAVAQVTYVPPVVAFDWASLLNIPADLADGDDNTQLSEAEVDAFVSNNNYFIAPENVADGSILAYDSILGMWIPAPLPAGVADGDDDTIYDDTAIQAAVLQNSTDITALQNVIDPGLLPLTIQPAQIMTADFTTSNDARSVRVSVISDVGGDVIVNGLNLFEGEFREYTHPLGGLITPFSVIVPSGSTVLYEYAN